MESVNECLFAPALSHDVGLLQLHAQVLSLSAALVADDHQARGRLVSVLCLCGLLELSSDWLSEDVGAVSEGPLAGVLGSVAEVSAALLKLFVPNHQEAVCVFYLSSLVLTGCPCSLFGYGLGTGFAFFCLCSIFCYFQRTVLPSFCRRLLSVAAPFLIC